MQARRHARREAMNKEFWSPAHNTALQVEAVASPSLLIGVAGYGTSEVKRQARAVLVASIAALCDAGINAALVIDTAATPVGEWPDTLAQYGCRIPGTQCEQSLWCARASAAVTVRINHHNASLRYELSRQHLRLFVANLQRFDWFMYTEEDTGWVPHTITMLQAQFRLLMAVREQAASIEKNLTVPLWIPGALRWEPLQNCSERCSNPWRSGASHLIASLNDVPMHSIFSPDLAWRQVPGAHSRAIEGVPGRRYLFPANPNQGFWLLPRAMLRRLWPAAMLGESPSLKGSPFNPHGKVESYSLAKEYWGGGWMLRCKRGCVQLGGRNSPALDPLRERGVRVVPCELLRDLLVMHMSAAKYRDAHDNTSRGAAPIVLRVSRWFTDFEGQLSRACRTDQRVVW